MKLATPCANTHPIEPRVLPRLAAPAQSSLRAGWGVQAGSPVPAARPANKDGRGALTRRAHPTERPGRSAQSERAHPSRQAHHARQADRVAPDKQSESPQRSEAAIQAGSQTAPAPLVPAWAGRVALSPSKVAWLYGVGLVALLGLNHVTPTRALGAALIGILTACCGHSVGLHRGTIHGAFKMGRSLQVALWLLFCQTGLGGPLCWIRLHYVRDYWQSRGDTPRYFAYRHGLLRDYFWKLHLSFEPRSASDWQERYEMPIEYERDPVLRWLEATWQLHVVGAFLLVWALAGFGAASVLVAGRVAVTILFHWFVGYCSHVHGRQPFAIEGATEEGRDGWLLGVLSFGEGFHNTHHALPRSAWMGCAALNLDLGYLFILCLEKTGLVRDVIRPGDERARKPGARPQAPRVAR